ncbi:VOC family protein [Agromyces intestinalis]|uniref:VOC family protein n=1 Tax=Agromyces intestinalis TaxID=2592652 RepID=A0A5C1YCF8_9MICO|nr:VOC family protein [Agromyces intestinalis]QEO13773.1 VOC family protein [Agromyces intestinalis]
MASLVVHFEIHASEPQRLIDFYTGLFGWEFTQFGDQEYWVIDTGEGSIRNAGEAGHGINGGLTRRGAPGVPESDGSAPEIGAPVNGCTVVIGVDDADESFAKALELGAIESVPLEDLPGVGRVGYLLDPDHNVFGLISAVLSDGTDTMAT